MHKPIKYTVTAEIDFQEMVLDMSREQAKHAILEIDRCVCDLEFTFEIAKAFCEAVFKEGVEEYSHELSQFVAAMSTPNKGESK